MTWREPEMQRDLGSLMDAMYPPGERSPETAAALDQIMNGATFEEREAGREALSLPDEEDEDYYGRQADDPDWGRQPDPEQARVEAEDEAWDRAPLAGGEPEALDQFGMPAGFDYYADAEREHAADANAHIEPEVD